MGDLEGLAKLDMIVTRAGGVSFFPDALRCVGCGVTDALSSFADSRADLESVAEATMTACGWQALLNRAARFGAPRLVALAMSHGADPSAFDDYAIRAAAEFGHVQVVKMLVGDDRVDALAQGKDAFKWADRKGHTRVLRVLLLNAREP